MASVSGECHCGAITVTLATAPTEITECNCSLCRRWGVLWAYLPADELTVAATGTDTYAWNGKHVDFHRCSVCGCITHWVPRKPGRKQRGVNARLLAPAVLAAARLRHLDGADTNEYLD